MVKCGKMRDAPQEAGCRLGNRCGNGHQSWVFIGAVTIVLGVNSASAPAELGKEQDDSGITQTLAERAGRVSDLHYALQFKLRAHAESTPGEEVLRFKLRSGATQADLPLDYLDGTISSATLNGVALDPLLTNGHLFSRHIS
jgi:hypothetical protein